MSMVLSSTHDQSHCKSSSGSFDGRRLNDRWPPTFRPIQLTWTKTDFDCQAKFTGMKTVILSCVSKYTLLAQDVVSDTVNPHTVQNSCYAMYLIFLYHNRSDKIPGKLKQYKRSHMYLL